MLIRAAFSSLYKNRKFSVFVIPFFFLGHFSYKKSTIACAFLASSIVLHFFSFRFKKDLKSTKKNTSHTHKKYERTVLHLGIIDDFIDESRCNIIQSRQINKDSID